MITIITALQNNIYRTENDSEKVWKRFLDTRLTWTYHFQANCWWTHTLKHPLNSPLSGTTRVSQYQKGKTNLNFTEARNSVWQCHHQRHMQVCITFQSPDRKSLVNIPIPDRKPCKHPITQFFYRPDALPAAQPTASKHWRQKIAKLLMKQAENYT